MLTDIALPSHAGRQSELAKAAAGDAGNSSLAGAARCRPNEALKIDHQLLQCVIGLNDIDAAIVLPAGLIVVVADGVQLAPAGRKPNLRIAHA